MSYSKIVTLWCDGLNCWENYESDCARATTARKYAKKDGWVYRDGEDYCPSCKEYIDTKLVCMTCGENPKSTDETKADFIRNHTTESCMAGNPSIKEE